MSFFIIVFAVVVAVVFVTLAVATHFDTSLFLGYACNLYGETTVGIVDIILVGIVHFGKRRWVCFVNLFCCKFTSASMLLRCLRFATV